MASTNGETNGTDKEQEPKYPDGVMQVASTNGEGSLTDKEKTPKFPGVAMYGACSVFGLKEGDVKLWCRCGLSQNQPWCDAAYSRCSIDSGTCYQVNRMSTQTWHVVGSTNSINTDLGTLENREEADEMPIDVAFHQGLHCCENKMDTKRSHKGTGFQPMKWVVPKTQTIYELCACKYTRDPPYCDAKHTKLASEVIKRTKKCSSNEEHVEECRLCTRCGWTPDF